MSYTLKWGAPTIKERGPVDDGRRLLSLCIFYQAPQRHWCPFRLTLDLSGFVHRYGCPGHSGPYPQARLQQH